MCLRTVFLLCFNMNIFCISPPVGPYSNGNPDMVLKRQKTRLRSSHRKSAGDSGSDFDDIRGKVAMEIK